MPSLPLPRALTRVVSADVLEFWLQHLDPLFAVEGVRARVEAVRQETARVRTLVLRPNANWRGFRAGQHVALTVEIDGRRLARTFSLSGGEDAATVELTVGLRPDGHVTAWLHERLGAGAIVELSQAHGHFVLPDDARIPLLLIAGGTGITPFLSMLRTMAERAASRDIVLLCYAPRAEELIARRELAALPGLVPGLRVYPVYTREAATGALAGHFVPAHVEGVLPDVGERLTYVCGPQQLMDAVEQHWRQAYPTVRLHREWFAPPRRAAGSHRPVSVTCAAGGQTVSVAGVRSLLEELEAAGLHPRHGCRAGICRQCTCVKASGVVEELRTGRLHDEPAEAIQLCAVRAGSDLVLAL